MFRGVNLIKPRKVYKENYNPTSIFPPPSSKGGISSFTGVLFVIPLTPIPCCLSSADSTSNSTLVNMASYTKWQFKVQERRNDIHLQLFLFLPLDWY